MSYSEERKNLRQAIASLLDAAGTEVHIDEITAKLNIRELRGLKYRIERALSESYEAGARSIKYLGDL